MKGIAMREWFSWYVLGYAMRRNKWSPCRKPWHTPPDTRTVTWSMVCWSDRHQKNESMSQPLDAPVVYDSSVIFTYSNDSGRTYMTYVWQWWRCYSKYRNAIAHWELFLGGFWKWKYNIHISYVCIPYYL